MSAVVGNDHEIVGQVVDDVHLGDVRGADHGLGAGFAEAIGEAGQFACVEGGHFESPRVAAAGDSPAALTGDQGRWPVPGEGVQLGAVLPTDGQDVGEAMVGDEHDPRALALQEAQAALAEHTAMIFALDTELRKKVPGAVLVKID